MQNVSQCVRQESTEKGLSGKKKVIIFSSRHKAIDRVMHWTHSQIYYRMFLYRAGYLTLFGVEQNNNSTDPSKIYEEYRKFDGLLTKIARGTLKPGNTHPLNVTQVSYCR